MDEEALARELAELERAQRAHDPAWEDVVHGARPVDEVIEQKRAQGHDEAELRRMAELMAPLPEEFEEALTDRLLEQASSPGAADEGSAPVRSIGRSRWQQVGWIATGLAAAAAVALVVLPREHGGSAPAEPEVVSLPEHELGLRPTVSGMRSVEEGPVEVTPGGTMTISLRPATDYAIEPHVWACAERGGTRRPLELALRPARPGTTIEGVVTIPEDLPRGEWTLLVVVDGRPAPDPPCEVQPGPGRRLPRVGFRVVEP